MTQHVCELCYWWNRGKDWKLIGACLHPEYSGTYLNPNGFAVEACPLKGVDDTCNLWEDRSRRDYERDKEESDVSIAQGCCFFGLTAVALILTFVMLYIGSTI